MLASNHDDKAARLSNINAKQQKIQALRSKIKNIGAPASSDRPPKVKSKSISNAN